MTVAGLREIFRKRGSLWLLLLLLGAVFCLNCFALPAHDELAYAFEGQTTPFAGAADRVSSLADIAVQQYTDYCTPGMNGRVILHSIVALFAGFRLYLLFDLINTGVFLLLVIGILREGRVNWRHPPTLLFGAAFVWWFLWYAKTCSMNAAFAVNYLWTACATCYIIGLWERGLRWRHLPLFFLYGWSQELFVLPMIAALAAQAALEFLYKRKLSFNWRKLAAWLLTVLGAACLCLGPAAQSRAAETMARSLNTLLRDFALQQVNILMLLAPVPLLLALIFAVWKKRRTLLCAPHTFSLWWFYALFAYGFYCAITPTGIRFLMPLLLAAVICVIQERRILYAACPVLLRLKPLFTGIVILWALLAAGLQGLYALELRKTLTRYAADAQGITTHTFHHTLLCFYSTRQAFYTPWHWALFRLEYNRPFSPPAILPETLYSTLYRNPPAFFAAAEAIAPGLFIHPADPRVVVMRGVPLPTAAQRDALARHWAGLPPPVLPRFLPGRFTSHLLRDREHLALPTNPFVLTAADGQVYSLFTD